MARTMIGIPEPICTLGVSLGGIDKALDYMAELGFAGNTATQASALLTTYGLRVTPHTIRYWWRNISKYRTRYQRAIERTQANV